MRVNTMMLDKNNVGEKTHNNSSVMDFNVVWLAALIQLISALDFMMIMPLGPDLSRALNISPAYIGYLGGGYALAAALSSLLCARYLDRFDRKHVALISLLGITLSTWACALAWNMESLFFTRLLAGVFAGPATSIALAIVVDATPLEQRGRAMAIVMGAFSLSAIAGVPLGLELAMLKGWSAPFYVVGGLGLCVCVAVYIRLPRMTAHLGRSQKVFSSIEMLKRPVVWNAFMAIGLAIFSTFLIVPNIAAYFQFNLDVPRGDMSHYYVMGGVFSLFAMQFGGYFIDRFGAMRVTILMGILTIAVVWDGFLHEPWLPTIVVFTLFMVVTSTRTITVAAVNSQVAAPWERAGFMSLQNVFQHIFSGSAAVVSSMILTNVDGHLGNMAIVAWLAIALTLIQPAFLYQLLKRLCLVTK
ncbi:MFS transporter [Aeromonas salmonicida]|uniref:MFS transporter n=1 Tax=Aeromonas salmonicida TaxID=645 RepID=UPI00283AB6D2|nr:MFS transporter [Aeromonas salmonicida]